MMVKKIAFQVFGKLRLWDHSKYFTNEQMKSMPDGYIPFLIKKMNSIGIKVDVYGTFWKDDYSQKMLDQNKFHYFTKVNLIEPQEDAEEGLWNYGYCLLKARNNRLRHTIENNIKYDFVLSIRPDVYIVDINASEIERLYKHQPKVNFMFKVFGQKEIKYGSSKPFDTDDKSFMGTYEGMNLFSLGFNHMHLNKDNCYYSSYHTDPCSFINMFSLDYTATSQSYDMYKVNLIRHDQIKRLYEKNLKHIPDWDLNLRAVQDEEEIINIIKSKSDDKTS